MKTLFSHTNLCKSPNLQVIVEKETDMFQIDGYTRLCGLIGNPVEHTLSPVIHNTLAQKEGRNLVYVPFCVEDAGLKAAVEGAYALNVLGLNVTVPYKSRVLDCLSDIDEMTEKIGAANTLVRTERGYKGYNTDMLGLYRAMCSEGIRIEGEEIIVLGAGGAGRAVVYMCLSKGADKVYLFNRTLEKAQQAAEEINSAFSCRRVVPLQIKDYTKLPQGKKFPAIQATSVGLFPNCEQAVVEEPDFYSLIHTGYDLIYKPVKTKFMSLVEQGGGQAYHGLKMLLYQGIISYELWNHIQITEEDAQIIYEKMKDAMGIAE